MTGPVTVFDLRIVMGALVLIPHEKGDWCTGCLSLKHAGEDFHFVCFLAHGRVSILSRLSAV